MKKIITLIALALMVFSITPLALAQDAPQKIKASAVQRIGGPIKAINVGPGDDSDLSPDGRRIAKAKLVQMKLNDIQKLKNERKNDAQRVKNVLLKYSKNKEITGELKETYKAGALQRIINVVNNYKRHINTRVNSPDKKNELLTGLNTILDLVNNAQEEIDNGNVEAAVRITKEAIQRIKAFKESNKDDIWRASYTQNVRERLAKKLEILNAEKGNSKERMAAIARAKAAVEDDSSTPTRIKATLVDAVTTA